MPESLVHVFAQDGADALWNATAFNHGGPSALTGVALARELMSLGHGSAHDAGARKNVAAFLREWADAIDEPPNEDAGG